MDQHYDSCMKEEILEKITSSVAEVSMKNPDNFRIVLPRSSCPPQRRVIAPGRSVMNFNSALQTSAPPQGQNVQDQPKNDTRAKLSLSAKEYKEYLEDMELKIRYMKNDIEFKQSQIQNKKKLSAQSHDLSLHINGPPAHRKQTFASTHEIKAAKIISTLKPRSTDQVHHKHMGPSYTYVQKPHHNLNKLDNTLKSASKGTFLNASNHSKPLEVSVSLRSSGTTVSVGSLPSSSGASVSVGSLPSSSGASVYVSGSVQIENKNNTTPANNSQQTTKVPTMSVFQRLGGLSSVTSPKPIYVSPSKNQAIWSHSPDRSIVCHPWNKRQAQLSASFGIANKDKIPEVSTGNSQNVQSSTSNTEPAVAVSKYKLVKPNISSQSLTTTVPSLTPSISYVKPYTTQEVCGTPPHSNIPHSHKKSLQSKSVIKKTPKSKVSAKIVSKYKMTRLSPTSVSSVAPQFFNSPATVERTSLSQPTMNHTHRIDRRVPGSLSQRASINSTPHSRIPKLEVVMAAKLVSKYRLKRLSPASASKAPPQFPSTCISTSDFKGKIFNKHKLSYHVDSYASSPQTLKSKTAYQGIRKYTTPLKKSYHVHQGGLPGTSSQNLGGRRFVLDRRDRTNTVLKTPAVKNRHKLDRRPQTSSSPGKLTKVLRLPKKHKQLWVSPRACTLPGVNKKQQSSSSRFKWRRFSSTGSNFFQSCDSLFKWSQQRSIHQPNPWDSFPKHQRDAPWMRKSNLVMIRGVVYKSPWQTAHKLNHHGLARDNFNGPGSSKTNLKLITLRGAHFHADSQGKKLCRAGHATNHQAKSKGFDIRKRHRSQVKAVDENTILAASRVVHRSIAVAAAKFKKDNTKWKREKQHCIFFSRFGKCHRGEKCKYVHDPEKVAVCTRFLRGKCDETRCQFSHNASEHKMPVCLHYLQGLCSRDNCPYLHVRVNPDAPVCKDFHNGYCSLGKKCKKLHSFVCPSFAVTGHCSRGESCSLLHRRIKRERAGKEPGINTKPRLRKRKRSSSAGSSVAKRRITEMSVLATDESRSQVETCMKDVQSNATCDSSQGTPNAGGTVRQPEAKSSYVSLEQSKVLENKTDVQLSSQPTASPPVASPKKGSAPLASQPSFISLLSESPVTSKLEVQSQGPSIKPLFIAKRLATSEQFQVHTSLLKDTSCNIPKSSTGEMTCHKPVPTPAFLSSRMMAREDPKQQT